MTPDDEAYVHFQECLTSLNRAWLILGELAEVDCAYRVLCTAAYHMALIEYAKPFKQSRGNNKRHVLNLPAVPQSDVVLHNRLLDLRDQVLAHSDLTVKDAKVYCGEIAEHQIPMIISNTSPQFPEPAAVKGLIERLLDQFYSQIPLYEQRLKAAP